ncbi:MAG: glutamate-1-semialdehyde 2,1-aminomutase [Anaerolineae bacterium]|jgi:glutamate-1-semialdehyde 2,1-aminomutase|nr:glutamate-1-semialdehyde 2,1-aminomutase [Anaerolineae bacterium]MBT3714307.1 glutamate-1-semialdehyde 2,1-aminomutase [Anaerolineae bacterium]MBT4312681.1 glutamate-1-semialdehyde 2,1-aminomutase [Anaerolineae bacterium]MBT4458588.1 glutamate-1-semialdehyde 2,1-aminomutase [Anaerolineae bacterium]MBT4843358.1 glutamate-1-semialdehyde 2,1-aminomutase [Anaerolineae bacterium]
MNIQRSIELFSKAKTLLPGGVDSPVRAFNAVGGQPLFIERGEGAHIYDVDGNQYIDYVLSWGPLILGHAHPLVVESIQKAASLGTSYGAPSPLELDLAELVMELMPNIEMLRFVNSGTEATMTALRLARAYTKRDKIIKFEGCYHGHADMLLVQAGSGVATLGLPDSPGVPASTTKDTLVARFNDLDSVEALFMQFPGEISAIIVEPVAGNMGVVPPAEGFLEGLRKITTENGALLIFDEVMTGFRAHLNGAQARYNIVPDLTTLGKVIGGGLPVGAYGGKREIMQMVAPVGPMYQAGTLSGNPLAMMAGIATLGELKKDGAWQILENAAASLGAGVKSAADAAGIPIQQTRVGTMFSTFFSETVPQDWSTVGKSDTERFGKFFTAMLKNGVYLAPSQFEAGFVSTMHTPKVIEETVAAIEESFKSL